MRASIAIAALVGTAIAAPGYGYQPEKEVKNVHVVVETVVQTVYVTEGESVPTPVPEPVYEAPVTTVYEEPAAPSSKYEAPIVTPTPEPEPYVPAPAPSSAPAPANPPSTGYMATVDEYRSKLGLKALTWSSKLEGNAQNVVDSSNGAMVHKLNAGTFAQVLAPADKDKFESAFVGGWLCEMPNLPGLDGVCKSASNGWDYAGQTGHAEILTNPSYKEIACAWATGIWCCDLA